MDVVFSCIERNSLNAAFWVWCETEESYELGRAKDPPVLYDKGGTRKECRPEVRAKSRAGAREVEEVQYGGVALATTA